LRVAFFPDAYNEVDGVANVSRHFEAFARNRGLAFLTIHAGPDRKTTTEGSVTRLQLPRSWLTFPLDRAHEYDLGFWRYYRQVMEMVGEFAPDLVQITGPSDLGMLGALVAHKLGVPLAATWQTNLHQYAKSRLTPVLTWLPGRWSAAVLEHAEKWTLRGAMRFYRIPRLLFAPNPEIVALLEARAGKPCLLMSHSVDTEAFSPQFRDGQPGPFTIGYVGRLTREKNVRLLARLDQALRERGNEDFRFVIVGEGAERPWLEQHMPQAEFTGVLTRRALSRAFANMDLFVFPSETDTFGLAVLEALASCVPAVVTASGGPKYSVQHGRTGFVADKFDEFVGYAERFLHDRTLAAAMGAAGREYALATNWERIFEDMYRTYERCFLAPDEVAHGVFDAHEPEFGALKRLG
jgi:glycosyltransferase involved in cell wall biosynthesis